MKVLFICGFLGAGKSRFINTLSAKLNRKFVIVENEFSDIDIDSARIKASAKEVFSEFSQLSSGCICCSLKQDFANSLLTIANSLEPDYLIVEPSGVAKMADILHSIKGILYEKIELLAPVCLINVQNYRQIYKDYQATFLSALNVSASVICSHSENLSEQEFVQIRKELRIKDDVKFWLKHYDKCPAQDFADLLQTQLNIQALNKPTEANRFIYKPNSVDRYKPSSVAFRDFKMNSFSHLIEFLGLLIQGSFGQIVRAKANIEYVQVDVVSGVYYISGLEAKAAVNEMVLIGSKLKIELLQSVLNANVYQ